MSFNKEVFQGKFELHLQDGAEMISRPHRNTTLDAAKAIAIILVLLGHSIQYCSGLEKQKALGMGVSLFIYSFHVPLFMLVSGWLSYSTMQRHSVKAIINKRVKTFIWPILTITVVHLLVQYYEHRDIKAILISVPFSAINSLWFLWALAIATILMCFFRSLFQGRWWGYVVLVMLTLVLPDGTPLRAYMFLVPFFVTGYVSAKYIKPIGGGKAVLCVLFGLFLLLYFVLFSRFGYSDFIYSGRYSILGDCDILDVLKEDAYRFSIGLIGSVMVMSLLHLLIKTSLLKGRVLSLLTSLGRATLPIYVFQDLIISFASPFLWRFNSDYYILNVVVAFIVMFTMSIVLTKWAYINSLGSQLFLGQSLKERNN